MNVTPGKPVNTETFPLAAYPPQLTIAIAGNPNAGKTSLFNALTGLRQKVANYPGVTVERKEGSWTLGIEIEPARVIDLPGLYSLEATSVDEQIARNTLLGQNSDRPDVVVAVVDATSLVRNLYLATQLMESGCPLVIALPMFDVAEKQNVRIDVPALSDALGVPVIPVVARQNRGLNELAAAVLDLERARHISRPHPWQGSGSPTSSWQTGLIDRYRWIEKLVTDCVEDAPARKQSNTQRLDALLTNKIAGPLILFFVMLFIFQAIFSWADLPMRAIEGFFSILSNGVRTAMPPGMLTDLIVGGIIPGVGGVLVFLPQILLLFFFITILEDSGYMARAAFLMDRVLRTFGLSGKAFVPLLSSFACAVPGIMATRTIENPKDRIATIMIAPFMSCSARLPVYTLMIAAFFSGRTVLGFISLGALVILSMYLLGLAVAVIVSWLLKHTFLNSAPAPFVMELPPYRMPNASNVLHSLLTRAGIFVKRAGTVILAISLLLWALVAFPRVTATHGSSAAQIENSYAGRAGRIIEPLIRPLGFDWKIGVGLISSFAARETIISTLSIVYNVSEDSRTQSTSLVDAIRNAKRSDGSDVWTPLVALSLMIFFVLACQCMSTVAVVRRESNSWRWPLLMVSYMLGLAYVASFVTFQGGRLLGFS